MNLFQQQLKGEQALNVETARRLFRLAQEFAALQAWDSLTEEDLVFIRDPGSGELHACSVMGVMGEIFSLTVYVGNRGYAFFRRMHDSKDPMTAGEFFAEQHSIYVHFVQANELTPPDRELFNAVGYKRARGERSPLFRVIRPGYHPWYLTESEARLLAEGLLATATLLKSAPKKQWAEFWRDGTKFPMMSRIGQDEAGRPQYQLSQIPSPTVLPEEPRILKLDEQRINRILACRYPSARVLELDQIYGAGMVGERNERKYCVRTAVAIDSETAHAFLPAVAPPEQDTGEFLADTLLGAIEQAHFIPTQVCVRNAANKAALAPLAQALGFELKVRKSMPAFDFARNELLRMMGDPSVLSM